MATESILLTGRPDAAAARVVERDRVEPGWLDAFIAEVDRQRSGDMLRRVLDAWGINQSEAAALFGVTRQALSKWLANGLPSERVVAVADLAAATDLLVRYLKRERIPAVVRRPVPNLAGRSLIELVGAGDTAGVLAACRAMFDVSAVHA
jgi:hypothetical protein